MTSAELRPAVKDDAFALAELINFAGEGLPHYLWEEIAGPGETAWEVGSQRARRMDGGFSYRNATVAVDAGSVAAMLLGYPLPAESEPVDFSQMPALFVPLQELENLAPGTWYINVLAVYPEHRRRGLGTRLLALAEEKARETGCAGLSLIVSDANGGARRLYERRGYRENASRPMVKADWDNPGQNWVLMVK